MPRVSVVIPFFNSERYLEAAVNSVVAQQFSDWELLLVNDGSTDDSARIAQRLLLSDPRRVRCLEHDGAANRGISASRNLGVTHARGDLVAFLDSDDLWLPEKLGEQVRITDAHPAVGMVFGTPLYRRESADGGDVVDEIPGHSVELERVHEAGTLCASFHPLGGGAGPCPSDILMRRSAVDAIGGFEERFNGDLQLLEDQPFFAKVFLHLQCYVSEKTWTYYRVHPESVSSRVRAARQEPAVRVYFFNWLENELWGVAGVDHVRHALATAQASSRRDLLDACPNLRCDGGARARLWYGHDPDHGMCVDILAASADMQPHDIQLNIPATEVREGVRYRIMLEMRASRACMVNVGFARRGEDWSGLGLYEAVAVVEEEWLTHDFEFAANADADRTRIHVDACQSPVRIEIRRVRIARADASCPDQLSTHAVSTRAAGSWVATNSHPIPS